jgi:hypothetical protein
MRSHVTWFVLLAIVCIGGPYLLHVEPHERRQWQYVAITLAFLAWLLMMMVPLGST